MFPSGPIGRPGFKTLVIGFPKRGENFAGSSAAAAAAPADFSSQMSQRRAAAVSAAGRPSGTDGSDFSYRMVVDSRYTKVAKGKSRLRVLLLLQAASLLLRPMWPFLFAPQTARIDVFSAPYIVLGFISLVIGELGRRRSLASLLRLYIVSSSVALAASAVALVRSDIVYKEALQNQDVSGIGRYELLQIGHVVLDAVLQFVVVATAIALVKNMSPPKRSSLVRMFFFFKLMRIRKCRAKMELLLVLMNPRNHFYLQLTNYCRMNSNLVFFFSLVLMIFMSPLPGFFFTWVSGFRIIFLFMQAGSTCSFVLAGVLD